MTSLKICLQKYLRVGHSVIRALTRNLKTGVPEPSLPYKIIASFKNRSPSTKSGCLGLKISSLWELCVIDKMILPCWRQGHFSICLFVYLTVRSCIHLAVDRIWWNLGDYVHWCSTFCYSIIMKETFPCSVLIKLFHQNPAMGPCFPWPYKQFQIEKNI